MNSMCDRLQQQQQQQQQQSNKKQGDGKLFVMD
jgi:hypothetical protein